MVGLIAKPPRGARPDPGTATSVAEFVELLGALRAWSGQPSYRTLAARIRQLRRSPLAVSHSTVADVFKPTRRRLDLGLVVAIVRALGADEREVERWRSAHVSVHAARSAPASRIHTAKETTISAHNLMRRVGIRRSFPANTHVFREGEDADGVVLIEAGVVKLTIQSTDTAALIGIRGPGDLLGAYGCIDDGQRQATATAMSDVDATFVPRDRFLLLLSSDTDVCLSTLLLAVRRAGEANRRLRPSTRVR